MQGDSKSENAKKKTGGQTDRPDHTTRTGTLGERETLAVGRRPPAANDPRPTEPTPVTVENVVRMAVENASPVRVTDDPAAALNAVILNCTAGLQFRNYREFIARVFCDDNPEGDARPRREGVLAAQLRDAADSPTDVFRAFSNRYAYDLLKAATEAYLSLQCACFSFPDDRQNNFGTVLNKENSPEDIRNAMRLYLIGENGDVRLLPYIDSLVDSFIDTNQARDNTSVSLCAVSPLNRFQPCFIELIWSYWHEEGMLVQTINAISMRFQNRRIGAGRDPLAHLEMEPLRPLNNLLWGYIQDEQNRLTIARRAYEYQHEYGLTIYGKAVPEMNPVDVRSKFIEAFHNLLHVASVYYKDQSNRFVVPDAFPLLNAIKEVHLILAEGAHNQFGDLPLTARAEMLIQKWLLSRPEVEKFLGGRFMVPYPERWMGVVDQMKTLQGWTDVTVRHFRDLAEWGEQLLLSIRWGDWSNITATLSAENWALIWRDAIQGYIHSYRAVTGVDLAASSNTVRLSADSYTQPSELLRSRLALQRRP